MFQAEGVYDEEYDEVGINLSSGSVPQTNGTNPPHANGSHPPHANGTNGTSGGSSGHHSASTEQAVYEDDDLYEEPIGQTQSGERIYLYYPSYNY